MATDLGQAYVQIMPSAKGIKGSIQNVLDPESKSAGKSAGLGLTGAIKKVIVTAGIGAAIKKSITEGGALEQSIGGIETLFKDSADVVRKYADDAYKTVGVSANDYMENVTSFSASLLQSMGGDTQAAAKVAHTAMVDMGDNANKMGTDMRDIQNAYQGFAKGNYTMLDNLKLGYGGTKTEVERLLKDAQKLTGVKYNIDNLDDVFMAVHAIQQEIGITGTTALEAEETIEGSLNAMKAAFTNTLGALAIGENVAGSFTALAQTISTFIFGNLLPMIGTIFKSLPTAIIAFIQAAIPLLVTEGGNLIKQLGTGIVNAIPQFLTQVQILMTKLIFWLREQFPTILQNGVEMIVNFANGFFEGLPSVLSNIGQILNQVLVAIFAAAPAILDAGYQLIAGLAQGLWNNFPEIMTRITDIMAGLLQTILERYPDYFRKGWEIIGKLAQGLWNNLPEIITTIGNILANLITRVGGYLPKFLTMGLNLIGEMALGLIKAIPGIVAKIPQIINALVNSFSKVRGKFRTIGADLIKGLWAGIDSVRAWIGSKIDGFMNGIIGGIKGFFGIKSPSTVMEKQVGKWLPLGLAEGIEKNTRPVTKAMSDLATMTTGNLQSEIAISSSVNRNNAEVSVTEPIRATNDTQTQKLPPIYLQINGKTFAEISEEYFDQVNGKRIMEVERGWA